MTGHTDNISTNELRPFLCDLLTSKSFFAFDAKAIVDAVLVSEACGIPADGMRLLKRILSQLETGEIDPRGRPLTIDEAPALAFLDGSSAAGMVGVTAANKWLASAVPEVGAAVAVVKGGRDLGHPAVAVSSLAEAGFVGLCSTSCLRDGQESTRVGAAFPTIDGRVDRFEADDVSLFSVVLSALASGHSPEAKAASANASVAEHVVVAIDPGRTTSLAKLAEKLAAFSGHGRLTETPNASVELDAETRSFWESIATLGNVAIPWKS